MQAVIMAAGPSSRFYPLSNHLHKSMIKVLGKPILEYTIEGLKKLGIKDIVLIVGPDGGIKEYFSDGKKMGVSINYFLQSKPIGAGNGLLLAKDKIKDKFLLLNPAHPEFSDFGNNFLHVKDEAILAKKTESPWNYGIFRLDGDLIKDLIEKPKKGSEPSNLRAVGVYLFSKDFFSELESTPYEHYQLEAAIRSYVKKKAVKAIKIDQETITLKYPWDLLNVKNYLLKRVKRSIGNAEISKSAEIIGDVVIEDGVKILEGARIKGPCFIAKNSFIGNNAIIRDNTDIEENCVIGANIEIKNSIIMANSKTHSGFIGDSIIGENSRIGAQFCTGNVRLDRGVVKANVNGEKLETGLKFLGVTTGKNVKIGIKASTMPGIIIGENAVIGPSTTVLNNVGDNTKYFTKFQEVVSKNE